MGSVPVAIGLATLLGVGAGACASGGSSLARDDGGSGPGTGASTSSTGAQGGAGAVGGSGGGAGDPEPAGPARLTVVNGTVDASAIRLCFVSYPMSPESTAPWPPLPGLAFARGRVVDRGEDVLPEGADVEILLLTGDLGASEGLDCATILAGSSGGGGAGWPTVSSLGVLPASALVTERSLLLVTTGCVGGQAHTDPVEELVCGPGYGPLAPTAGIVAAAMSRIVVDGKLSMQFVQASLAMPAVDLRVLAGIEAANPVFVASSWSVGAIVPYPPLASYSLSSLGVIADASVDLYASGSATPTHSARFGDAFASSELSISGLADGEGVVFVAVGAVPGLSPGPWWHELRYTVVAPDAP